MRVKLFKKSRLFPMSPRLRVMEKWKKLNEKMKSPFRANQSENGNASNETLVSEIEHLEKNNNK